MFFRDLYLIVIEIEIINMNFRKGINLKYFW